MGNKEQPPKFQETKDLLCIKMSVDVRMQGMDYQRGLKSDAHTHMQYWRYGLAVCESGTILGGFRSTAKERAQGNARMKM